MDQAVLRCVSSKVWAFQTFKLHYSSIDYQLCHLVDIKHITKGSIYFFRSDCSRLQSLQVREDVYSNVSTVSRIDCLIGCHIGGYPPIYQQGPQGHVGVT